MRCNSVNSFAGLTPRPIRFFPAFTPHFIRERWNGLRHVSLSYHCAAPARPNWSGPSPTHSLLGQNKTHATICSWNNLNAIITPRCSILVWYRLAPPSRPAKPQLRNATRSFTVANHERKSTFLEHQILNAPGGFVFLDPHGHSAERIADTNPCVYWDA
jgi:hypothetical protein